MNSSQLISIVLPVFNAQPHLPQAIESMLGQTYRNFELIILEDGSTDSSLQYLLTLNDPRVRLVHDGLNRGLSYRLNQGLMEAKGRYICRMDADDISMSDRLRLQAEYLDAHPEIDLVGGRAVGFCDSKGIIGFLPFAYTHEALCACPWNRIPLPHPTWMARREWYLSHPYRTPEVVRAEDQDLLLQAYPESRYSCIEDVVLAYRLGRFSLRRTLIARYSLLKAQVGTFHARKQYLYIALACLVTCLKSILDLTGGIPGLDQLIARRRTKPLELELMHSLQSQISRAQP